MAPLLLNRNENRIALSFRSAYIDLTIVTSLMTFFLFILSVILCCSCGDNKPKTTDKVTENDDTHEQNPSKQPAKVKSNSTDSADTGTLKVNVTGNQAPKVDSNRPSGDKKTIESKPLKFAVHLPIDKVKTPENQPIAKQLPEGTKLAKKTKRVIELEAKKEAKGKTKAATVAKVDAKQSSNVPVAKGGSSWPSLTDEHTYWQVALDMQYEADDSKIAKMLNAKIAD